ncbi:DUF2169 family type VI secretion system accessory protein [Amorphus sp. MBR-141]
MPGIMKPMRLGILTKCTPHDGGSIFTVTALGLFDLLAPDYLLIETGLWPTAADQLPPGSVLDLGAPKPNGEVIVAGSAIPPGGHPVDKQLVEVRVGPVAKRILAIGNRVWTRGDHGPVYSDPVPFTHMPLVPQLAFGGAGFAENPLGRGIGARGLYEGGYKAPLPNLENPAHPILEIDDTPHPAWFGPYPPDAPWRQRFIGTYDRNYMKTHFPGYPADFDTRYFLAAPADQQIKGFFKGDEPIHVSGMSSSHPTVESRLPGIRARAFVHRKSAPEGFHELHMHLDTVWIFGSVNKGLVGFRGSIQSEDIEGDDIAYVMIAYERLSDPPRDPAHYAEVYRLRRDPDEKIKYLLADYQLSPEIDPALKASRRASKVDAYKARLAKFEATQAFSIRKQFEDHDLPPALLPKIEMPKLPPIAIPTRDEVERGEADFAEMLDDLEEQKKFADTMLVELEELRQAQEAAGGFKAPKGLPTIYDFKPDIVADPAYAGALGQIGVQPIDRAAIAARIEALPAEMAAAAGSPPEKQQASSDAVSKAKALLSGEAFDDLSFLSVTDEEQFAKARARALDLPEAKPFAEARRQLANAAERMDAAGLSAILDQAQAVVGPLKLSTALDGVDSQVIDPAEAAAGQEQLAATEQALAKMLPSLATDTPGEGFDALIASMAEFANEQAAGDPKEILQKIEAVLSLMEPMVIEGGRKARLALPKVIEPMPPLNPATAKRLGTFILEEIGVADLAGRDLAGADLAGADLSGIDLSGTMLDGANLEGANLSGVRAHGTTLSGANLKGTRFAGADIKDTNFGGAVLDGADFTKARVEKPNLMEASLAGVVLADAELVRWTIANISLHGVVLDRSTVSQSTFIRCDFDRASFRGARLFKSVFIEGSARGAHFDGADLEKTGFIKVPLDRVRFNGARLLSSGFVGDIMMKKSSFAGITAVKSSWMAADIQESCFLKASLKECNLMMADARRCDFRLAVLHNTLMLRADFRECDFFGADLTGAMLRKADLSFASLRQTNAYATDFSLAKLLGTDLHHAHLIQTAFRAPETVA